MTWSRAASKRLKRPPPGTFNEDIFDLSETVAFYNLSNRMAHALDMMPNPEYHAANREQP